MNLFGPDVKKGYQPKGETPESPVLPPSGGSAGLGPIDRKHEDMKQIAKELHDMNKQLKLLNDILRRKM